MEGWNSTDGVMNTLVNKTHPQEFPPQAVQPPQSLETLLSAQPAARQRLETYISHLPKEVWIQNEPAELARICGCGLRHLRRLFRQCFGVSLRQQQTEWRLHRASQLLMETDDKILSIAWAVGFRHLGLFSRMFKRRFGMTPSAWRAKFRQK